jgi:dihydrofolate synthase/folylpolyglutamate synthase
MDTVNGAMQRWLEDVRDKGVKLGLERIQRALELAGSPQRSYPSALVGGTNGKGSTVAFASALLCAGGNRVGSTISPHLSSYRERFRVDGVIATDSELDALATWLRAPINACDELAGFTFFELGVLLALCHFQDSRVDAALVEVGMGGEFDASRGSDPQVAALVSVDLDHQQFLGESVEAIARTKARIAPVGGLLVVGEAREDRLTVIREEAQAVDCELVVAGLDYRWRIEGGRFSYRSAQLKLSDVSLGPAGSHQGHNAACALGLVEALCTRTDLSLPSPEQCAHALTNLRIAGRLERFAPPSGGPAFLLDGAHNPAGARALAGWLVSLPRAGRRHWLFASMADKERSQVLAALLPHVDSVVCTAGTSSGRFEPPGRLAEEIRAVAGPELAVTYAETPARALEQLMAQARPEDEILVAGSLYLVGDVRALLGLPLA